MKIIHTKKDWHVCKKISVANDQDERTIELPETFSGRTTKDEDQLQCIPQAVADHRRRVPQGSLKQ